MASQAGEFTFRLSATGGDQLVRILRNAGDAGEQMAARILRSAQATGGALTTVETGATRAAAALARVDQAAAGGFGGARFQRGLQQAGFQIGDFVTQIQGGSNAFVAFAQQGSQLAGSLAGGLAGLAVSLGAVAAQWLFQARSTEDARGAEERFRGAAEAVNAVLLTREERARRAAEATLDLATATTRASIEGQRAATLAAQNRLQQLESARTALQLDPGGIGALSQALNVGGLTTGNIEGEIARQRGVLELQQRLLTETEQRLAQIGQAGTSNLLPNAAAAGGRGAAQSNAATLAELARRNEEVTRSAERLASANRTADEVYQDQIESINRLLPELERLYGVERANEIAARASVGALEERNRALERGSERASGAARELGFAFSSAFEDAIIKGKSLGDVLRGLSSDIARVILRRTITDPIAGAFSQALSGFSFSGLFGGSSGAPIVPVTSTPLAMGGVMTEYGQLPLQRYASGGVANRPQVALFGEGRTPEAFVPLPDGRRIPVAMQNGGDGVTVNMTIDARGADPNSVANLRAAAAQIRREAVAAVFDAMRRGGSARAVLRGA